MSSSLLFLGSLLKLATVGTKKFHLKKAFTMLGIGVTTASQYKRQKYYKERAKYLKEQRERRREIDEFDNL